MNKNIINYIYDGSQLYNYFNYFDNKWYIV